jgi:NAD(P)-dependent dehydrogenase (short-subunit alcohol dehydrogenase family)
MKQRQGEAGKLSGRRALVLGGSGGIGRAMALELGARGAHVIVHGGSSRQRLDSVLAELAALGAEAEGFLHPLVGETGAIAGLVEALLRLGDIDILVLAFGPFIQRSIAATSVRDWESLALLDLALPGALSSALLPLMAARGWGRILLFGGTRTDAIRAYSSNAAYAAAKTGLAVLAKSLAAEGASSGVACILACPGFVETEYLDEAQAAALASRAPRGRLSSPAQIAALLVPLLAADPCLASGAVISLDGGLSP